MGEATYVLVRPPDLVWLTVTAVGLREQTSAGGPELVADGPQARLIVEFSAQHIAETVPGAGSSSSLARLAGSSRLYFQVDDQPIPLSANGILSAMSRLPLIVKQQQAQGDASTLEIPWRILLGLDQNTRCAHRSAPAADTDGVTELWHTRIVRADDAYAAVYPLAALPVESPFADQTPLGGFFTDIGQQVNGNPGQPMSVNRLILSGCGAWFAGSISWPQLDWTHRAAMARDFYVQVSERGVLFPFGHRAAYVDIVERQFSSDVAPVAALRVTRSLMILDPVREYGVPDPDPAFPFQQVELGPLLVTELDQPASTSTFWPMRGGAPVMFSVRARAAGDVIGMRLPLLFSAGGQPKDLDGIYAQCPQLLQDGTVAAARPSAPVGRFMAIAMKSPTEVLEGAVQQVNSLTFGGKTIAGDVGFHPVVTGLEVGLPAVRQLLRQADSLAATLSDELLNSQPGGTPPDVLLQFPSYPLNFGSARAGVVAAPDMNVDQLSRTLGPIVAQLPTKPADLFPPTATLLGILPLRSLIAQVTGRPTITWTGGDHPIATMNWAETLTGTVPPFAPASEASCQVSLTVTTKPADGAPAGPPPVITCGKVTNFTLSIPPSPDTLVILTFKQLTFHAESGALPSAGFVISDAKLTGNLAFVQVLQNYLPEVGNTAPKVDVSDDSITATFITVVPTPLAIGVFTLRNLLLKAAITLSLTNQPVLVDFAFASREQPFLVAVSGFGGGGYLELAVGAGGTDGGLQRFVGALEFGACAAMVFGVAAGEVHVFGGVVFTKRGRAIEITGYLRIGGMVRVLGVISVSVELTIAMTYTPNVLTGSATLVITVDLTFWSASVEISCSKTFAGSQLAGQEASALDAGLAEGGLSVQQALGPDAQSYPWQTYCQAFAQE